MGKTIVALLRMPFELFRIVLHLIIPPKDRLAQSARSAEEERLDRIRNPHKYGPGKL
jgi:hypothetical protein